MVEAVRGPEVAVGAVVLADLPTAADPTQRATHVLLIQRGHAPLAGTWTLPGGRVRRGEKLIDAVRREVREETALEVEVGGLVEVVEIVEGDYHYVTMDYWSVFLGDSRSARAGDDAADARWIEVDRVDELAVTPAVRRVVHRALELERAQRR